MTDDKELDPLCVLPGSVPATTQHLTPEQHMVFERNIKLGGPTMWDPGRTKGIGITPWDPKYGRVPRDDKETDMCRWVYRGIYICSVITMWGALFYFVI